MTMDNMVNPLTAYIPLRRDLSLTNVLTKASILQLTYFILSQKMTIASTLTNLLALYILFYRNRITFLFVMLSTILPIDSIE